VRVAVWLAAKPGQTLHEQEQAAFAVMATKYPEAKVALDRQSKPMDVADPALAQRIESEYVALITAGMKARVQPLTAELRLRGFGVTIFDGMPSFVAILPKRVILELNSRAAVGEIYLIEDNERLAMDSAARTIRAQKVWNKGYDGSGVKIAILECGNVSTSNTWIHHASVKRNGTCDQAHPTWVASAAAIEL